MSDPVAAAARDAALLAGDAPPPPPFPSLEGGVLHPGRDPAAASLAGTLGPQGRVTAGGMTGRFDDIVTRGWVVLTRDAAVAGRIRSDHGPVLDRLGARIVLFGSGSGAVADSEGMYGSYLESNGIVALVMRPDFYVYGAARTEPEALDLMDALAAEPALAARAPALHAAHA